MDFLDSDPTLLYQEWKVLVQILTSTATTRGSGNVSYINIDAFFLFTHTDMYSVQILLLQNEEVPLILYWGCLQDMHVTFIDGKL